jgi:hypothetical protein
LHFVHIAPAPTLQQQMQLLFSSAPPSPLCPAARATSSRPPGRRRRILLLTPSASDGDIHLASKDNSDIRTPLVHAGVINLLAMQLGASVVNLLAVGAPFPALPPPPSLPSICRRRCSLPSSRRWPRPRVRRGGGEVGGGVGEEARRGEFLLRHQIDLRRRRIDLHRR